MRKIMSLAIVAAVAVLMIVPAHALPGDHGCVALASGYTCYFTGLSGGVAPTGVISATDASWTITHGSVTDASGTGPGVASVAFSNGVLYMLSVGPGTGAVAAGTPE